MELEERFDVSLIKTIRKSGEGAFKSVIKYAKYKRLFSRFGIELKNCDILLGVNIILLVDRGSGTVYRCSLNELGGIAILRNYDFLQNSHISDIPDAIGLWQRDGIAVSAESLVQGEKLSVEQVGPELSKRVFRQIYSVYRQNFIKINFNLNRWFEQYDYFLSCYNRSWVEKLNELKGKIIVRSVFSGDSQVANTRIHGDLTFRNIMLNGERVVFFDFDRTTVDFPEFDILLFNIDYLTHSKLPVTYDTFFTYVLQLTSGQMNINGIKEFYNTEAEFGINAPYSRDIRNLFLYRMMVHILQSFNNRQKQPLELLDRVIDKF